MPKVLVVGVDTLVSRMFLAQGWELASPLDEDIDLVQFTGGADVSPLLYGEQKHPATFNNPARDESEGNVFITFKDTPKAGICRGGQLLNVLSGGSMWQHVDNHTGSHLATDLLSGEEIMVTSTHHQMMCPSYEAQILMHVNPCRSTYKQTAARTITDDASDIEALFYPNTNSLCFQPHPEYVLGSECCNLYFSYIEKFFNLK